MALWPDIKRLLSKVNSGKITAKTPQNLDSIQNTSPFWTGFACNALNPKTMLFIVALFSQVISDKTPLVMELGYGIYIAFTHFAWFALVACLLTSARVQKKVMLFKAWIERITGVLLASFGIGLLME